MYDHIGLKVGNLDASVRFYTAALAPLGYVLCSQRRDGAGFGPKGEPALWLYLHKGPARRRPCRLPRAGSRRDQEIPCRGPEGRRPRQRRRRPARRLQPDLLRGVPDRSRWQQCRGGLHVGVRPPVIARSASDEAIQLPRTPHGLLRFARNDGMRVAPQLSERLPWLPSTRTFRSMPPRRGLGRGARFRRLHTRLAPGFVLDTRLDGEARIVTFANGNVARELLVDCDDARRRLVYAMINERVTHHQRLGAGDRRRRRAQPADLDRRCAAERDRALYRRPDGSGRGRNAEDVGRSARMMSSPWT